jgi:PAS domain S-box-containing protein
MRPLTKTKAELAGELAALQSRVRELEGMATCAQSLERNLLQATAELHRHRAEVSALMESFGAILQYRSLQDSARAIFLACRKLVGATAGYVALLTSDGERNEILFLDSGGRRCTVDPSLPMPVRGLRAEAYRTVKAVYDNDFGSSAWVDFLPHGHMRLRNVLFAPLVIDGTAVGLLGLANKAGGFNQDDLRLASGFGEIAAVALKNSRTVEALRESEERFRLAFEGSNDGVCLVDLEGRFLKVNERMCEILGYTRDALEGLTVHDVTHPEDLHISATFIRRSRAGEIERSVFEKRYLHKKGHVIWGQVSASLIRAPGGGPLCYISHLQDVTERKRAEEALRAERDFNLAVLSTVGALVVVLDRDGRIVRFNRACEQTTGYTFEEVKDTPFWDLFLLPEEIEPVKAVFARLRSGQFPNEHENYWVAKGGGRQLIQWSNTALLSPEGTVEYIIGTGIDITARREAEQALQKSHDELEGRVGERTAELARANEELQASEAKYSTLVENSLTGISINLEGRIVFANDRFAEIFGYPRDELIGIEFWRLVHPEDRAMVEEMRRGRLKGDPVPAEYEARGLTKEGKTIWVARRNTVIDYEGKRAILGNLVEVTKRRSMEEALRRSEKELRHLSSELLSAQESERGRIARELHDGIGQWLSAIKFRVEGALQQARRGGAEEGFQLLELVIPLIRKAIDEIRRISMDLRPATLDSLGILATISWLCRQFEETYRAIRITKNFAVQEEEVPEGLKVVIYRILQEALNNVAKHSEAGRVRVHLGKGQGRIELSVKDNGKGFELASVLNDQAEEPGFGLASMRERTEVSGGSFCLESGQGKGTLIRASWPAG